MEHLSGLDASFLHLETSAMPMHVGVLMPLDVPAQRQAAFPESLRHYLSGRIHLAPVFSRQLAPVLMDLANPVWVAAEPAIDEHLHRHTLPAPGGMEQLQAYVARVHAQPLPRELPLWDMHLIDGLEGDAMALFARVHHAALDGVGASSLMRMLFGAGQGAPEAAPPAPAPHPGTAALLSASVGRTLGQAWTLARQFPAGVRALAGLRNKLPSFAPRTALNASITGERSFAALQFALDPVADAGRAFNGTINDAVLGMVADALRRYLTEAALPQRPLVAAVPVDLREREDGHVSNQVSMWLVELATGVHDFSERMRLIVHSTHEMRAAVAGARPLMLTDFPGIGMPWLMSGAAGAVERLRLADTLPPLANIIVSNVPGPAEPLHVAGVRVRAAYPVSIVAHGLALNVTVQSYCGNLEFGLVAATRAVPDLPRFAAVLRDAHSALLSCAQRGAAAGQAQVPPARVRRRRPPHVAAPGEDPDDAPRHAVANGQRQGRSRGKPAARAGQGTQAAPALARRARKPRTVPLQGGS